MTGLVTSTGAITLITTVSPTIMSEALTVITGVCLKTEKLPEVWLPV